MPGGFVPWRERVAYGVGGITAAFAVIGVKGLAIPVYQMTLKVDPVLLGVVLAAPRFWDAVCTPVAGYLSDGTRSRFGRRRPYIVVGAFLVAVAYALIWMVPANWSTQAQLGWLLVASLLFYTFEPFWAVPYQSLGYEMTPDYHERTAVMGVQNLFSQVSSFCYQWLFPLAQLAVFGSVIAGVRWVTAITAVVFFGIAGVVPGLFVRERFSVSASAIVAERAGFWKGCVVAARNRGLLVLVTLGVLLQIAGFMVSGLDYYVLVYYVCGGSIVEGSIWKGVLSSAYTVISMLSIGAVAALSRRFDKRNALIVIYVLAAIGGVGKWFFFRAGYTWLCLLDPILCAPIYTASGMIAQSMVADICDEDEWRHGSRREGLFAGVYSWMGKVAISLALLGVGIVLNTVGFDAAKNAHQDPHALLYLRYVMVYATSVSALMAIVVLHFYPLNSDTARTIRTDLERRRGIV